MRRDSEAPLRVRPRDARAVLATRVRERCAAPAVLVVDRGASVQEEIDALDVAARGGDVERRPRIVVARANVDAVSLELQQALDLGGTLP